MHFWLRHETKPHERRAALTPGDAAALVGAGHRVTVESSDARIFPDADYAAAGCVLGARGGWPKAPEDAVILGLKELPHDASPLTHRHVYFAHAYKNQAGWKELLGRFVRGGGTLLDLEYLTEDDGRRVAAFGYWAGFAGAAVGLELWAHQQLEPGKPLPPLKTYDDQGALVKHAVDLYRRASVNGRSPKAIIIGAKGRCGTGASDFLKKAGVNDTLMWDMAETAKGGPFKAILERGLLVNCVLVSTKIPPFLTAESLDGPRTLSAVVDVSCDPSSPNNPLPIYDAATTMDRPAKRVVPARGKNPALDVVAVDHLPSMLPRESSQAFSAQLLPRLLTLEKGSPVWRRAEALFKEKSA